MFTEKKKSHPAVSDVVNCLFKDLPILHFGVSHIKDNSYMNYKRQKEEQEKSLLYKNG